LARDRASRAAGMETILPTEGFGPDLRRLAGHSVDRCLAHATPEVGIAVEDCHPLEEADAVAEWASYTRWWLAIIEA
jgi:hypothetical protein